MKHISIFVLLMALLLCLVACQGNGGKENDSFADKTTEAGATSDSTTTDVLSDESKQPDAEETFSPDLNLTEIDRFE